MSKSIVILDFNNIFTDQPNSSQIKLLIDTVLERIFLSNSQIDEINVRVYGGWFKDDVLTQRASVVMQFIKSSDFFPIIVNGRRRIRGSIEFVDRINGLDLLWRNTHREKKGLPRIIVNNGIERPHCSDNKENCPIEIIKKFSKSSTKICPVAECSLTNDSIFIRLGQKMVDTMMVCDILTYGEEGCSEICVLTDDVDLLPAIALCKLKHGDTKVSLGIKNKKNRELYSRMISPIPVEVFNI